MIRVSPIVRAVASAISRGRATRSKSLSLSLAILSGALLSTSAPAQEVAASAEVNTYPYTRNQYTAQRGPLWAFASGTSEDNASASCASVADFGVLRARANATNGQIVFGVFYSAPITSFTDTITIDSPGRTGQTGFVTVRWRVDGTQSAFSQGQAASGDGNETRARIYSKVQANNDVAERMRTAFGERAPAGDDFLGQTQTLKASFTYGTPFTLKVSLEGRASVNTKYPGNAAMESTLRWGGFGDVTDGSGNIVAYTVSSKSGYEWSKLAPTPDNKSRVLWTEAGGRAMILREGDNPSDAPTYSPVFGPYTNWTAKLLSVGSDNRPRLLWENTNGRISLWTMDKDAQGFQTVADFGPYDGWRVQDMEVGSDNKPRVLWRHTSGAVSIWVMNTAGTSYERYFDYGPYAGWTAHALSIGTDGMMRVLWRHTDGTLSLWRVAFDGQFNFMNYGPYPDWQPVDLEVGEDNRELVTWRHTSGKISLWTVQPWWALASVPDYGSYPSWDYVGLSAGLDNKPRLLWSYTPGSIASLWRIDQPNSFTFRDYTPSGTFTWKPKGLAVSAP